MKPMTNADLLYYLGVSAVKSEELEHDIENWAEKNEQLKLSVKNSGLDVDKIQDRLFDNSLMAKEARSRIMYFLQRLDKIVKATCPEVGDSEYSDNHIWFVAALLEDISKPHPEETKRLVDLTFPEFKDISEDSSEEERKIARKKLAIRLGIKDYE